MKRHLIAALFILPAIPVFATNASAELGMSVAINLPGVGIAISSSPEVMVIPGTYVYFAPDADDDLFFYHGYWYRTHKDKWYRSAEHDKGWVVISFGNVPSPILHVPPGFRSIPPGHQRIPYGQLKKNWKSWERDHHWDNDHHAKRGKGKHKKHKHD